jgi:predicted RNA-binding protein with PIN domain
MVTNSFRLYSLVKDSMPFLIDGHNLIAATPGISLSDLDDEQAMIQMLTKYARTSRRSITVYFDRASLAAPLISNTARVEIHFVRPPRTADDAIRSHIKRLGREVSNWTVVSSDREVRAAAKRAGARVMDSRSFASRLWSGQAGETVPEKPEQELAPEDIKAWEKIFNNDDSEALS